MKLKIIQNLHFVHLILSTTVSGSIIVDDMKIPTYLDKYLSSICIFFITLIKFIRITVSIRYKTT